jgi:hypothetical protein
MSVPSEPNTKAVPDAVIAAAAALLVAALNELRAQLRSRQADRDRAERLADAASAAVLEERRSRPRGSPD